MITLHFLWGGGMPDMPQSFGCEATDWHRSICPRVKDFALGVGVVILVEASVVQIFKVVGASAVQ